MRLFDAEDANHEAASKEKCAAGANLSHEAQAAGCEMLQAKQPNRLTQAENILAQRIKVSTAIPEELKDPARKFVNAILEADPSTAANLIQSYAGKSEELSQFASTFNKLLSPYGLRFGFAPNKLSQQTLTIEVWHWEQAFQYNQPGQNPIKYPAGWSRHEPSEYFFRLELPINTIGAAPYLAVADERGRGRFSPMKSDWANYYGYKFKSSSSDYLKNKLGDAISILASEARKSANK